MPFLVNSVVVAARLLACAVELFRGIGRERELRREAVRAEILPVEASRNRLVVRVLRSQEVENLRTVFGGRSAEKRYDAAGDSGENVAVLEGAAAMEWHQRVEREGRAPAGSLDRRVKESRGLCSGWIPKETRSHSNSVFAIRLIVQVNQSV